MSVPGRIARAAPPRTAATMISSATSQEPAMRSVCARARQATLPAAYDAKTKPAFSLVSPCPQRPPPALSRRPRLAHPRPKRLLWKAGIAGLDCRHRWRLLLSPPAPPAQRPAAAAPTCLMHRPRRHRFGRMKGALRLPVEFSCHWSCTARNAASSRRGERPSRLCYRTEQSSPGCDHTRVALCRLGADVSNRRPPTRRRRWHRAGRC